MQVEEKFIKTLHRFLIATDNLQLSESNMERSACESSVLVLNHNYVDGATQGRLPTAKRDRGP